MIDKLLNNYKKNQATIEMLKIKINQWEDILTKDTEEIDRIFTVSHQENLGVQKSHNTNPIESMIIRVEDQKKKVSRWIIDANEKINKLQQENKMVDIMLESLDEESYFIITQKHFEKKKWNIITYHFNSKFRNVYQEYITSSGVRKKYEAIKRNLESLFENISPSF